MGRWNIGRAGIMGSKVEVGRGGRKTGGRCSIYMGGRALNVVIIAGSRKKRLEDGLSDRS